MPLVVIVVVVVVITMIIVVDAVVVTVAMVIVIAVIALLMGVPFDDTGQRLALDRHLETSSDFVGAKQHVRELFIDRCESRVARLRSIGGNGLK